MERISDEKLAELETQHGEVICVGTTKGDVVLRSPKRTEYDRYLSFLFDEKKRSKAQEVLVRACRVYPTTEELDKMIESAPGIVVTCANPLLELAGQVGEPEVRKSSGKN